MAEEVKDSEERGAASAIEARAGKYLTFQIADEEYGLEILKVQEIIQMLDVTHIPQVPAFVRGVINLRGKIIPIVNLRMKFGMKAIDDTDRTSIIVVGLEFSQRELIMGIIVDEVSEVLDIEEEQIEPPPCFGSKVDTSFILGMGKVGKRVLTMLDIDRVLSEREMDSVAGVMKEAA